ncbi:MAG TPA: CPBP family intramembrane glutamic endopeptidase [Candidatus Sulfotelmatobacter sp.]|nr:CPBP family intramembrane glutamic endopeptidase [Candidatus Sulfotelmatobacter sp.]
MLALIGGIMAMVCAAIVTVELLRRAGVAGFHSPEDTGSVVVMMLGQDGPPVLAGFLFLMFHDISWREISGLAVMRLPKQIQRVAIALAIVVPVMLLLKLLSMAVLKQAGWPIEDQRAVELLLAAKSTGMKIFFCFFAAILAPLAEEFVFRGLLFSGFKKIGWRKCGYVVVSLLFATVHGSAPIFLPLFVFALALTWLYETTEGLLAPVMAHGLFNTANLAWLFICEKYDLLK